MAIPAELACAVAYLILAANSPSPGVHAKLADKPAAAVNPQSSPQPHSPPPSNSTEVPVHDDSLEDPATHLRLISTLKTAGATFGELEHAATKTSEESAAVRGATLASGAKAMLMKSGKPLDHGGAFVLAVMSAAVKADLGKLKKILGTKDLSMAKIDDVKSLTGCIPGAVPPFGSLFPGVKTIVDQSLIDQGPATNFNSGLRTKSVVNLSTADYLAIEKPQVAHFTV